MRVLFFIPSTARGGAECQFLPTAAGIAALPGFEVSIAYLRRGDAHDLIAPGIRTCQLDGAESRLKGIRYLLSAKSLANFIERESIDLVYSLLFEGNAISWLARRRTEFRFVASLRVGVNERFLGRGWKNRLFVKLLERIYRDADVVVANSDCGLEYFKLRGLDRGIRIDNFLSPDTLTGIKDGLASPAPRTAPIVVGTLSRLSREKNPFGVIDAAAKASALLGRRVQVRWVGGVSDVNPSCVTAHAETRRVEFVHVRESSRRFNELASFDVAVLFSEYEGTSNFLLESMVAKRKIVSSRVGDCVRILHPETSRTVAPGDVEALAVAIAQLANVTVAEGALERVAKLTRYKFSYDANISAHRDLFLSLGVNGK